MQCKQNMRYKLNAHDSYFVMHDLNTPNDDLMPYILIYFLIATHNALKLQCSLCMSPSNQPMVSKLWSIHNLSNVLPL